MRQDLFENLISLKSDLESAKALEKDYLKIFQKDFCDEIKYLEENTVKNTENNQPHPINHINPQSAKVTSKNEKVFKEIYKRIVKRVHPDLCQDEEEKIVREAKMKEASDYMENENWEDLILLAQKEKISIPHIPVEYDKIMKVKIKTTQHELNEIRNKVCWVWCTELKPKNIEKAHVYPSMGIVLEDFNRWKELVN